MDNPKNNAAAVTEYYCVDEITGPVVIARGNFKPMYGEIVEISLNEGGMIRGQVMESSKDFMVVQTFEKLSGVGKRDLRIRFTGELLKASISEDMIGRVLDGTGAPLDGGLPIVGDARSVEGRPITPSRRETPHGVIETGVSAIDVLNTLIRGQKLPIFTCSGLSHLKLIGSILRNATLRVKKDEESEDLTVIFAGMGLAFDEYSYIIRLLESTGILKRSIIFLNKAQDPIVERIILPRIALTAAEYLAFDKGRDVLVILYDLTSYADALREVSSLRGELPGRMSYPPYLYTDLATLLERSGRIEGRRGSLTQLPVLTMPNDDMTHPVPDLTGYITEGQILLSRNLEKEGILPPIDIIPSLSRLMHKGSEGITREDHRFVGDLIYASYAKYLRAKKLRLISGEDALSVDDQKYLEFGKRLEREFISYGPPAGRSFEESLNLAWTLVGRLPEFEKSKIPQNLLGYLSAASPHSSLVGEDSQDAVEDSS